VETARTAEQQSGPLRVVRRPERKRLRVVTLGGVINVESEGAVAGLAQGEARALGQITGRSACGLRQLERGTPMVGEHLGVVFGAAERLDPLGDEPVLLGSLAAGDLSVGDVA